MPRALDTAFAAMCLAIVAAVLVDFRDQLPDSGTSTTTTSTQVVLPLAETATVALFAAVALVLRHMQHAGDRRLSELVTFMLCTSAAVLEYVSFVQPAGVVIDVGPRARALGLAAVRMLPAAAAVTFFLGVALVSVHVVSAGDGPVAWILSKMVLEAAAVLVGLMAMALYTTY